MLTLLISHHSVGDALEKLHKVPMGIRDDVVLLGGSGAVVST